MLDFTCYETHHRIPMIPQVRFSTSNALPNDGRAPSEMYFAEKYILDMHVSVSFYANNANFQHAREAAEKRATECVFKSVAQKLMVSKTRKDKNGVSLKMTHKEFLEYIKGQEQTAQ